MQQLEHTYAWSHDRSCFTLEQLHLAALPHFLQGGGNGTLLGQLSLGYLNSSPGLYLGGMTEDCGVSLEAMDANDGISKSFTGAVFLAVTGAFTVEVTGRVIPAVM